MFLDGLDELDQRIVRLLIENARMSYSDIGKAVGISRVAVKARVQALERRGVIEEYTTVINPQRISGAVSCYFEIETLPETLAEVTAILVGQRDGDPGLPGDRQKQAPRPRGGLLPGGDGGPAPGGHRPAARGDKLRLQHHPVPGEGHQGPAAMKWPLRKTARKPGGPGSASFPALLALDPMPVTGSATAPGR